LIDFEYKDEGQFSRGERMKHMKMVKNYVLGLVMMLVIGHGSAQVIEEANTINSVAQKQYKNIIFDLGGVLVEWDPVKFVKEIFDDNHALRDKMLGILSQEDSKNRLNQLWVEMDRGVADFTQIAQKLAQEFGFVAADVERYINQVYQNHVIRIEKGFEILEQVKKAGYKVYVLSNFGIQGFNLIEEKYGISYYFDGITLSSWVKYIKPEKEIYDCLLENHNLKAQECLFIDDAPCNIQAAQQQGIDSILCSDHEFVQQELIRLGIIKLLEIESLVEEAVQV